LRFTFLKFVKQYTRKERFCWEIKFYWIQIWRYCNFVRPSK